MAETDIDPVEDFFADIKAVIATSLGKLDDETRLRLEKAIERGLTHSANVQPDLALAEAVTVETILWTEANERGKQARRDLVAAVSRALVKGALAAL